MSGGSPPSRTIFTCVGYQGDGSRVEGLGVGVDFLGFRILGFFQGLGLVVQGLGV